MSHTVWFDIPLVCLCCGQITPGKETNLYTSALLIEPIDRFAEKGGDIEVELEDFMEAYFYKALPEGSDFFALEEWICKHCGATQWAKLHFHQQGQDCFQFVDAEVVPLNRNVLADIAFITKKAEYWVKYNLDAESEVLREAIGDKF